MKRALGIALLSALAFGAILIARMPAVWIVPGDRARSCTSLDGSLWSGTCAGLMVAGTPVGDLSWNLQPLQLLEGALAAHVTLTHGAANVSADVALHVGGRLTARNLLADLPLDAGLIPGVPRNLHGRAHLELALAELEHGAITQLQGRIEARDLEDRGGGDTALGSYVVSFPGGTGEPTGTLHDLAGPLALEGTLRLTRQPGFEVQGLIAPRREAPPGLVNNLRFLGSPDASGRRPFSVAGTF